MTAIAGHVLASSHYHDAHPYSLDADKRFAESITALQMTQRWIPSFKMKLTKLNAIVCAEYANTWMEQTSNYEMLQLCKQTAPQMNVYSQTVFLTHTSATRCCCTQSSKGNSQEAGKHPRPFIGSSKQSMRNITNGNHLHYKMLPSVL